MEHRNAVPGTRKVNPVVGKIPGQFVLLNSSLDKGREEVCLQKRQGLLIVGLELLDASLLLPVLVQGLFRRPKTSVSSWEFTGFKMYSSTSRCTASFAYSNSSKPVKRRIRTVGISFLRRLASSRPSIYGILMSVITTSGWYFSAISRALTPLEALPITANPSAFQSIFFMITWMTSSSSSTSRTLYFSMICPILCFFQIFYHVWQRTKTEGSGDPGALSFRPLRSRSRCGSSRCPYTALS